MKNFGPQLKIIESSYLKEKLHEIDGDQNDRIRFHRAISWLHCSEQQDDNPDLKFITLWIAFNACYANSEIHGTGNSLTEKKRFRSLINKLVAFDKEERFFELLWYKFSGPIRLLIDNKFAFKQFWDAQRGEQVDWESQFKHSIVNSRNYLAHQQVSKLLEVVLDRLYTVRNQLIHGGATYRSSLNRSQVKDASQILEFLIPIIIDILITNHKEDWGAINYPIVE